MKNAQRKKTKMLVSYNEGFYKPPFPYSHKVRGYPSNEQYATRFMHGAARRKWGWVKLYAGCRLCDGFGRTLNNYSEDCVCTTDYNGTYSKRTYRI